MKKNKFFLATVIAVYLLPAVIYTEDCRASGKPVFPAEPEAEWGVGWHPIAGYDDEYGLTLGAGAVIYREPADKNQDLDEIEALTSHNWAGQSDIMVAFSKYFKGNACSIDGTFGYQKYPDDFMDREYDAVYIPFEIGVSFKIRENLYAGVTYNFRYSDISLLEDDGAAEPAGLFGVGLTRQSGIGGQVTYKNTVKGELYKTRGSVFTLSGSYNSPAFFSTAEYGGVKADLRHYIPLFSGSVLAFQAVGKACLGQTPFDCLPLLEGSKLLRGGYRRPGKYYLAGQAELRFPVFWRIGGAVFLGAGEVENETSSFGSDVCAAAGIGLRFTLNKKKNITLRFDLALNNDGKLRKYIKIKEAF